MVELCLQTGVNFSNLSTENISVLSTINLPKIDMNKVLKKVEDKLNHPDNIILNEHSNNSFPTNHLVSNGWQFH